MSRKQKTSSSKFTNVNIHKVTVYAYPLEDRKRNEPNGFMLVEFSPNQRWGDTHKARFPLVSVWLDPNKTDSTRFCKVHITLPPDPQTEQERNAVELGNYLRTMPGQRMIEVSGQPSMCLTIDDHEDVLRYGSQDVPFRSTKQGTWETVPVYDSKAETFTAIMDAIKNYSSAAIAGVDLINLDCVSDEVLEEMGFLKSPDQMGVSPAMWSGDARSITSLGRRRYGSYNRNDVNDVSSSEVVESFLDLIEMDLNSKRVEV